VLFRSSPRSLGLFLHVNDVGALGETKIAEVRVSADVIQAEGIAHETFVLPVIANLDGADHVEPTVERSFVRFEAAKAREEAVRRADAGDLDGAAQSLGCAEAMLRPYQAEPGMQEEIADLAAEAVRLKERHYDASDRKYHIVSSMAVHEGKAAYLKKMRRRRPDPQP